MTVSLTPSWEELSQQRWGPGLSDPTPGIVIGTPNPEHRMDATTWWEARTEPYAIAEREAIQHEDDDETTT